jgi:hypothetical protein
MVSSQKKNPRFERFLYLLDAKHRHDKCMVCSAKPDYEDQLRIVRKKGFQIRTAESIRLRN